jgi:hypothetical protein
MSALDLWLLKWQARRVLRKGEWQTRTYHAFLDNCDGPEAAELREVVVKLDVALDELRRVYERSERSEH